MGVPEEDLVSVPNGLLTDSLLPAEAKVVYVLLAHEANGSRPDQAEIARSAGCSEAKVQRHLELLELRGYIAIHYGPQHDVDFYEIQAQRSRPLPLLVDEQTLAARLGLQLHQLRRHLKKLHELGQIWIHSRAPGQPDLYEVVHLPDPADLVQMP